MSPPESPDEYLTARPDRLADLTESLVAIDTQNPPGETVAAVDWLAERLGDLGLETERLAVDPAKPNLLATLPGEGEHTLCLNGHLDVVPFDPDEWSRDPLGEREGERVYGRGTTDMKGAVAAMVAVAEAYVETGTTPAATLQFVLVADEETGGDAGLPAVLDAGLLDADACVIGEPTGPPDRPAVAVADRGSIWLTMVAEGVAAHGSRPMLGENAIDRLYEGVTTLRERFGRRPLDVAAEVEPVLEESVEYYAADLGEGAARDLFRYPTINLGTVEGGDAINTVPSTARAALDVRLSPGVDTRAVLSAIRACADGCEGVTLEDVSWSVGSYEPVDSPIVQAVAESAADVTGQRVYRRSATGGGDAKALRRAGVPTVEFAVAAGTAHSVDEYTTVEALLDTARTYAALPAALAGRLE